MKPAKKFNKNSKLQDFLKKIRFFCRNFLYAQFLRIYDRIVEPKKHIKSLSIKNYATINIEKEYKYTQISNFGGFLLRIFKKLNSLNAYEYKLKQAKLDLNILNQRHLQALEDIQKIIVRYPKFLNQSLQRYVYLLKRTNFEKNK